MSRSDSEEKKDSSADSYEDEASDASSSTKEKKKKKEKKDKKEKKKDKKVKKKEKKKAKKDKKAKKSKKDKKSKKKRRRSPSSSRSGYYSNDDYSYSRSPSRPARGRSPPPRYSGGGGAYANGGYGGGGSYGGGASNIVGGGYPRPRSPMNNYSSRQALPAPPPMDLPRGRDMNLAEACEAAGRGVTSGKTTQDTEVQVLDSHDQPVKIERFDTFDDAREFPSELREELKRAGFPGPSQIQAHTWPISLKEKDIIGIAATGSGKTLAFLLPAFTQMLDEGHKERDGPGLLVMSPTRELAQQTETEASRFGRCLGFRCVAMYGGAPKGNQMAKYKSGVHTIVACPGRLNDFLEGGQVRLDNVRKLVLDEADRMLDMGFEPQIRKILQRVPRRRHTLFFTATWPREVRALASEILNRPYKVMIGNRDELKGNQDITQQVRMVDPIRKNYAIEAVLKEAGLGNPGSYGKALVFCNTKRMCEQLSNMLSRSGLPCTSIHGDKDQHAREDALNGLKSGKYKVMVATDVAARGLDIKGVGLVVNFDPANNTEDYVHRIGRTGRAGAKGFAITFMTGADAAKARGIIEVMERTNQEVSSELRALAGGAPAGGGRGRKGGGKGKSDFGSFGGGGGGGGGYGGGGGRGFSRSRSRSHRRRRSRSLSL